MAVPATTRFATMQVDMEKPQIIELAAHGVSGAHYANSYFTVLLLSVHFSTDIQARIHDCQLSHFCLLRATTCTHAHNGTTAVRNQRIKSSLNMPIDVVCYIGAYVVSGAIALQPREIEVLFSSWVLFAHARNCSGQLTNSPETNIISLRFWFPV